jgi:ribosomal peptide maturation radical SAM protein 1
MTKTLRSLLISLPWADYQCPALAIGVLASYARSLGFDVEAKHLHLSVAAEFGLDDYDHVISHAKTCGDAFCAVLLFPQSRTRLLKYIRHHLPQPEKHLSRFNQALKKIYRTIDWSQYSFVGFSVHFEQTFTSLIFAEWLKRDYPTMKIVFGGSLVSGQLGEGIMEHFASVDWCIDGEGETAYRLLLEGLTRGHLDETSVPGLIYRHAGSITKNKKEQLPELIGQHDPDFDHYFQTVDEHPKLKGKEVRPFLLVEVSRGCQHNCAFCCKGIVWKGYRCRPNKEVADSIKRLTSKYGVLHITLVQDEMTHHQFDGGLFDLIASHKRDYKIFCEIRANVGNKAHLQSMKSAGVCAIQIGIESFSTNHLRAMNKGTRTIDNLRILKFCEELGIDHDSNLLMGFPTETARNVRESLRCSEYALGYKPPGRINIFRLRDGSPIYRDPKKYGIRKIEDAAAFGPYLPKNILNGLKLLYKDFLTQQKPCDWSKLQKKLDLWNAQYENAKQIGKSILCYFDCQDFLCIEDNRFGNQSIILREWVRELYLFCDEIRDLKEIRTRFPDVPKKELRETLKQLFELKVMFTEGDDWLSIAIHMSPENRRHMSFL